MIIFLPPELETLVKRQIESGKFENAIDAIFAGMNLLGQKDDSVIDRTQTSLPVINRNGGPAFLLLRLLNSMILAV